MLQGYKTYIMAGLIAIISAAHYLGYLDTNTYQTLLGLLGAGAVSTLGAKINRVDEKVR